MNSIGSVTRIVVALLGLALVGSLALFGLGLQSRPAALVVFVLVTVAVAGAALLGARGGGGTSTPYW
ncbi:hypothetical protein [Halegenticoccus soli]|uniref:hypothetical protein n=1 Tax=Halegenticoccus soli TaxID=1985678 RepID=UPI000C6DA2A8|nr:hypothetical protein [Halegenticoccus soli]